MADTSPIPFFRPALGDGELDAVSDVVRSGWLTTGAQAAAFETEFAEFVGAEHAVALNSCTAALHLSLVALGIGPGDEVIVPTMTFAATAGVVYEVGATPILVDVNPDTLLIDCDAVEAAVTERTAAIMPVHYGGQAADLIRIRNIAAEHGLAVIEDAAHALPTLVDDQLIGAGSQAVCFSFYANKTITTGEGGMLTTNDEELAARVRRLSLHGLSRDAWQRWDTKASWEYDIREPGHKCNLTDVAAAMGRVQLRRCTDLHQRRLGHAEHYDQLFAEVDSVEPVTVLKPWASAWHLYVIKLPVGSERALRDGLIEDLAAADIGTAVHYKPLHLHSHYFKDRDRTSELPVATDLFQRILTLPLYPSMSSDDIGRVVDEIQLSLKRRC